MVHDASLKTRVLGFSGPIASGKSTLISLISKQTDLCVSSYGAYVKHKAVLAGLSLDRPVLQRLSNELLEQHSHAELATEVINLANWDRRLPLAIDGIRHSRSAHELRRLVAPIPFFLIFVATPYKIRVQRIVQRDGISAHEAKSHDEHETESEANSNLRDIADIVVDGTDLETASDGIVSILRSS